MPMHKKMVVFITGCSSGIGKALCLEYHRHGHRVIATARRLEALEDLRVLGIATEQLDVTDTEAVDRVLSVVIPREGVIDIVINNENIQCIIHAIIPLAIALCQTNIL